MTSLTFLLIGTPHSEAFQKVEQVVKQLNVTIMCLNDELSWTMSWVGCLLKDSELFILFAENSQILLKILLFSFSKLSFIW